MTAMTTCPECGGVGKVPCRGVLVKCGDCGGDGRVPADVAYPFEAYVNEDWKGTPDLIPIPKEGRDT
jgi:hypothetical protein